MDLQTPLLNHLTMLSHLTPCLEWFGVPKTNAYCMGDMQVLSILANTNSSNTHR